MSAADQPEKMESIPAGALPPWKVGELPPSPLRGWRRWLGIMGPGLLLAGASIGAGEWLFGPGVTAQYGGTLLWLATLSIVGQVFCNLEMIRYTLYCGEPVYVGFFRTKPGPKFWTFCYAFLDLAHIWPFMAANSAVVLAAAVIGHLPGSGSLHLFGRDVQESVVVKGLGYVLFLVAFIPLIFGGTIYRMLLRVMTVKLVVVLVYLTFFALLTVSAANAWEVVTGFFRFGRVPLRADTIIAGRHFTLMEREGSRSYAVRGTMEKGRPLLTEFAVHDQGRVQKYRLAAEIPDDLKKIRQRLADRAASLATDGRFYVQDERDSTKLTITGTIQPDGAWQATEIVMADHAGDKTYHQLEDLPSTPWAERARTLVAHQGLEEVNLFGYWREHGRLPNLDWALLAGFAAIAGAGGFSNLLYSSYARDKGWGMGARVGALPSLVGGKTITLSHVGEAFQPAESNRPRWRGWMRYVVEDQLVVWMLCNFIGMALPCMLSLEFIRHAPVEDNRVAALTAEGMAQRYADHSQLLWLLTLGCGFLVLFPGSIISGDLLARRWTDLIWSCSKQARRLEGHQVVYVYYSILLIYGIWGLIALTLFTPLLIAKIGAVLQNVALGFSALHTLYANRTLLPPEVRPSLLMQAGTLFCGVFFLGISAAVVVLMYM